MTRADLTDMDGAKIKELVVQHDKVRAVILVRNLTGLSMKEALLKVEEIYDEVFPERRKRLDDMSMNAEIFAVGPFGEAIVDYLEYPPESYRNTRGGTRITTLVCEVSGGFDSRRLAECLGIDPWDFNQYELDIPKIDFRRLAIEFHEEVAETVRRLHDTGFSLFYRPNG